MGQILLCLAALAVLGGLMYYSITYPWPSGKALGVWDFFALWSRELLIVIPFGLLLLFAFVAWVLGVAVRAWRKIEGVL